MFRNKIYHLLNSENNIETVKSSTYFKYEPENKNLKIQFVFFLNATLYYISQNTKRRSVMQSNRKYKSHQPYSTSRGNSSEFRARRKRRSPSYTCSPRMLTDWSFGLRLSS